MLIDAIASTHRSVSASIVRRAFWLAVLAAPILTIQLPVGAGRVLSISAFELVVAAAFVGLCRPYRPAVVRRALAGMRPLALFGALAVAHSIGFLVLGPDVQLAGLLRETVKYVGFAATVAMLVGVFRTPPLDETPPRDALATAALMIGLGALTFTWFPVAVVGGSYATVIGAVLTAIAVLTAGTMEARDHRHATVLTVLTLAAAMIGVLALWSKLSILCVAACVVVFAARRSGIHFARPRLTLALGTVALVLLMGWLYALQGWRFEISVSIRLELWSNAVELAVQSFPWGIGLGQFGSWLASIDYQAGETASIRFVHNQFLAFVTEAGAVGVALALIVAKLILDAAAAWRGVMGLVVIGTLLGALIMHDAIGLRALQLLLGYSLAISLRPGPGGSQRRRFA